MGRGLAVYVDAVRTAIKTIPSGSIDCCGRSYPPLSPVRVVSTTRGHQRFGHPCTLSSRQATDAFEGLFLASIRFGEERKLQTVWGRRRPESGESRAGEAHRGDPQATVGFPRHGPSDPMLRLGRFTLCQVPHHISIPRAALAAAVSSLRGIGTSSVFPVHKTNGDGVFPAFTQPCSCSSGFGL